jgi:hypothetical protein
LRLTREQLFFIAFGRVWAQNIKPAAAVQRVRTDPHSPNQFRVDGTLSNVPEFAKAFNCSAKAKVRLVFEVIYGLKMLMYVTVAAEPADGEEVYALGMIRDGYCERGEKEKDWERLGIILESYYSPVLCACKHDLELSNVGPGDIVSQSLA